MTDNPYEPTPDLQREDLEEDRIEDQAPASVPRLQCDPFAFDSELDGEEALWHTRHKRELDVPTPPATEATKKASWIQWPILLVLLITFVVLQFYFTDTGGQTTPAPVSSFMRMMTFGCFGVLGLTLVIVLGLLAYRRLQQKSDQFDPPLGGQSRLRFSELGLAAQRSMRDGRLIEIFCSWRQMQVHESPSQAAWILMLGVDSPLVLMRESIPTPEQRAAVDNLFRDIARWRRSQPLASSLSDVPDEAMEFFPDYPADGITFSVSGKIEQETSRRVRRFRRQFPALALRKTGARLYWILLLFLLAPPFAMFGLSTGGLSPSMLLLLLPPALVLGAAFLFMRWTRSKLLSDWITGCVDANNVWFNYRLVLLRYPIDSFPGRYRLADDAILLEGPTKESAILIGRSYFASPPEFEAASTRVAAQRVE